MLNRLVSLFLMFGIVVATMPETYAQKGGGSRSSSSSSRSSSSSPSSSSRPSSSSSSKGNSYSSGSSSSKGNSYSSGSSSSKGSSYSSGSSSSKGSSKSSNLSSSSSKSSPVVKSGNQQYSSGKASSQPVKSSPVVSGNNGKYSSGSSSALSSSSSGKQYTSGSPPPSTGPPISNKSADGNSRKPSSSGFNKALSNDAKRVESQKKYQAATAPKSTYASKGPDGKTVNKPVQASSPQVQNVRRSVTHERYVTYENRATNFYGGFYGSPMYYHDPFSPFLMGWLMSDALNSHQRATWMYHHQSDMDQGRYEEMLRKDAKLQAEIDQLKAQNVPRDPSYVPPEMKDNPDLMYSKDFVDASYNPVEVPSTGGTFFYWVFAGFAFLVVGGIVVYFLFMKEY